MLVKTAQEKIKILLIKNLTAKLNITANDIDVENKLWTKISEFGVLPESYIPGADIIGGLGRTKRDLSSVDFMALHDKVMQILVAKFETLTLLEQEASKEMTESSENIPLLEESFHQKLSLNHHSTNAEFLLPTTLLQNLGSGTLCPTTKRSRRMQERSFNAK